MDSQRTQKPLRRGPQDEYRDLTQSSANTQAVIVQDGEAGFTGTAGLPDQLASELFARLLLELPEHRRDLQSAHRQENHEQLERSAHKLLGAVVYCELPELATALRELKHTAGTGNAGQTAPALVNAIRLIDDLLACSGYSAT